MTFLCNKEIVLEMIIARMGVIPYLEWELYLKTLLIRTTRTALFSSYFYDILLTLFSSKNTTIMNISQSYHSMGYRERHNEQFTRCPMVNFLRYAI